MTKTEQTLLNRTRIHGAVYVNGKREHDAATKLVARGLASRYENQSGLSEGEYYIHPFTRRPVHSRALCVWGGTLYFA